jgi:hypothetical protein
MVILLMAGAALAAPAAPRKEAPRDTALTPSAAVKASTMPEGLMSSWDKLTTALADTLQLRDKQETLPDSSFWGEDKNSNAKKINALLDQALAILLQGDANDLRKQALQLREEIPGQQMQLDDLRNKRISAPESSKAPWVTTRPDIESQITRLEGEIAAKKRTLADINGKIAKALRQMGLDLEDKQIDIFLTSVTGDDLFQNTVIFANVKLVVEKLAELSREDRDNLEISRRYTGMYLVLNDLLIVSQEGLIGKIDQDYKPHLAKIRAEAETLRLEAQDRARQSQYTDAQKNVFKANAQANAMTVRVSELYSELLQSQRASVMTTLVELRRGRDVAENTYKTVRSTGDLRNLIRSGLELFDSIQALSMPQIQSFENDAIRKEFEEINKRLRK